MSFVFLAVSFEELVVLLAKLFLVDLEGYIWSAFVL